MTTAIIAVFVIGYLSIVFEHQIHINKAASAILTGVLCWTIYAIGYEQLVPQAAFEAWEKVHAVAGGVHMAGHLPAKLEFLTEHQLPKGFVEIAGILFFLMGAMTIVELVDAHEGFSLVTQRVKARNKVTLLAYCAGTGGSCLIIGSAAGVAAMGLERIEFMWYAWRIGPLALVGYLAGVAIYFLQQMVLG